MGLEFQYFQLIPLTFFTLIIISIYYKRWKIIIVLSLLMIFSLIFMPIKLTQKNIGVYENKSKFNNLPERIIIKDESFNEYQKSNLSKLKQESKNEEPK